MATYRVSRSRAFLYLAGAAAFTATGVWMVLSDPDAGTRVAGWFCAVFFGLTIPLFLRMLLDGRPLLIVDEQGLQYRGYEKMPWPEVLGAEVQAIGNTRVIGVELRRPPALGQSPPLLARWMRRGGRPGQSKLSFSPGLLGASAENVLQDINRHVNAFQFRSASVRTQPMAAFEAQVAKGAVEGIATGPVVTNGDFPVRWSQFLTLARSAANLLKLGGKGRVEFSGDSVVLHGRRPRFLWWSTPVSHSFHRHDVFNVVVVGKQVHFAIRTQQGALVGRLWAADAASALAIAAALPSAKTEAFQRLRQEHAGFEARLAQLGARAWVTPVLVGINLLVFAATSIGGGGIFEPNGAVMVHWGTNYGPLTLGGEWWRLFTATFLHFGIFHVALNMWALYGAGRVAERLFGSLYFLLLYLFAGLGGSLASLLWNPDVNSAGASGAIFGVYGALVAFFSRDGHQVPASIVQSQRNSTLAFIGYSLFYGMTRQGIDNAAHFGGLGTGLLLGWLMARPLDADLRRSMGQARLALGVLAGFALLAALAWPSLHPGGRRLQDQQYRRDMAWFQQQENTAVTTYNTLLGQIRDHKLSQVEFGRHLQQEVLPLWMGMAERISGDEVDPKSSLYESRQFLLGYSISQRDAFTLYAKGLVDNDSAALEQGKVGFAESERLIKEQQGRNKAGR